MIRLAIIVVLTLGAAVIGAVWGMSYLLAYPSWYDVGKGCLVSFDVDHGSVALDASCGYATLSHEAFVAPTQPRTERTIAVGDVVIETTAQTIWVGTDFLRPLETKEMLLVTQSVGFPLWIPFLLFAAYPAMAFIRGPVRRWRRRRKGLCVKCGYNLTGLPEPRCPECGLEC